MQIVERSVLGVRAARQSFQSPDGTVCVTLFPMVHVGEEPFYRRVYEDAQQHDVVLIEGVRSPVTKIITSSYRWLNTRKLGIVVQPRFPAEADARVVHADLSAEEFHQRWRQIPWWLRILMFAASPIIGVRRRLFATRESLAKLMELEDRLSSDELLSWDPTFEALHRTIAHVRDERLIEKLGAEIEGTHSPPLKIAIVFGAGHMRAVLRELKRRNFRTAGASWLTLMRFD